VINEYVKDNQDVKYNQDDDTETEVSKSPKSKDVLIDLVADKVC